MVCQIIIPVVRWVRTLVVTQYTLVYSFMYTNLGLGGRPDLLLSVYAIAYTPEPVCQTCTLSAVVIVVWRYASIGRVGSQTRTLQLLLLLSALVGSDARHLALLLRSRA